MEVKCEIIFLTAKNEIIPIQTKEKQPIIIYYYAYE